MKRKPTATFCNKKLEIFKDFHENYSWNDRHTMLKKLCGSVKKTVYPCFDIKMGHTAMYEQKDFLDVLTYIALTHDFTTNGSKTFGFMKSGITPHGNTVLHHLRKMKIEEVKEIFEKTTDRILRIAKKQHKLKGKVDVAIDITDHPYYGDRNTKNIVYTKEFRGTFFAYRYATIHIVIDGKRFTLMALPLDELVSKKEAVRELLTFAMKKVRIGTVYVDRGFFNRKIINLFYEMGIKFLMPAVRNSKIKEIMEKSRAPKIVKYRMGDKRYDPARFRLVVVKDNKGAKRVFATNLEIKREDAHGLFSLYSRRWGVETSYRLQKHDFLGRTTSKNFQVRLFFYLFSVTLYNLWMLLNILVSVIFKKKLETPLVTAKMFGMVLYTMEELSGDG
jgi:putative transposase